MRKKLSYIIIALMLFNPFTFTFAKTKVIYERSENLANQYIQNSISDENWKDNNPKISGNGKYFYTDDDKNPSYIEFKVSCEKEINCGFILVNIDGDDVAVPVASTSGVGPGEILEFKNGNTKNNKLYYFGAFDQYIENLDNGDVSSLNPIDDIENKLLNFQDLDKIELKVKEKELKNDLKEKLKNSKKEAKEFKKTIDFKNKKEEIKDQILKLPKEKFVINNLDMSYANYTNPGSSNVFIPGGMSSSTCNGATPCYKQFQTNYNGEVCSNGCSPTAVGIIFGYYDRNGFPNLVPGTASLTNSYFVDIMISEISNIIGTKCSGSEGATILSNVKNAKQYSINKGYTNSTSSYSGNINTTQVFTEVKSEINSGRPILIHILNNSSGGGHAVVGFGYKSTGTTKIVRVNMGWGGTLKYGNYYLSNIDQNLDSVYYNGDNNKIARGVTKFTISN